MKYRHKKTETIVVKEGPYYKVENTNTLLPIWVVEQGEDWEEVYENRNYEITAFQNGEYILKLNDEERYSGAGSGGCLIQNCLKGKMPIISVKRLSDGEEFVVREKTIFGTILSFYIDEEYDGGLKAVMEDSITAINALFKIKELFMSDDNVQLYNTDTYHVVMQTSPTGFKLYDNQTYPAFRNKRDIYKFFASVENAEEYIYLNQKKYSIQDVVDKFNGMFASELVKQLLQ